MALTWDVSAIPEEVRTFVDHDGERKMSGLTHWFIWATISVGIGEITEKTAPEFYTRTKLLEKLYGPLLNRGDEPYFVTPEDVRKHIGLKTNVFPMESRTKWVKRTVIEGDFMRNAMREYNDSGKEVA